MNLRLVRRKYLESGIFGELHNESGAIVVVTCEHAYKVLGEDRYAPKVGAGVYTCKRRYSKRFDCQTFEIMNVEGHSDILFHIGNYNEDSEGCVLVGKQVGHRLNGGLMLMDSANGFKNFMALLSRENEFQLKVEDLES